MGREIKNPTLDEVQQALGGIEDATTDEELERKRLGLPQEPVAKIEKRPPMKNLEEIVGIDQPKTSENDMAVSKNVGEYLARWSRSHEEFGELTHLAKISNPKSKIEFRGTTTIPLALLDEVMGKAIQKDRERFNGAMGVEEAISDPAAIVVEAYNNKEFFSVTIIMRGGKIVHFMVNCAGEIETLVKNSHK